MMSFQVLGYKYGDCWEFRVVDRTIENDKDPEPKKRRKNIL